MLFVKSKGSFSVHILHNQPRGGVIKMLTVDYGGGGGGLAVDYVTSFSFLPSRIIPIRQF